MVEVYMLLDLFCIPNYKRCEYLDKSLHIQNFQLIHSVQHKVWGMVSK